MRKSQSTHNTTKLKKVEPSLSLSLSSDALILQSPVISSFYSVHLQAPAMASGSSGRANSGSKGFDFATDDILCSYEDYANRDSNSNGNHSDSAIDPNSTKVYILMCHRRRFER